MQSRVWHRFYDEGVPPGLDFEARPLPVFLERSAREHADATALIFLNRQLTYRQFKEDVDRFATALSALGVERGTRVAIQLPNLPQTVIAFYAVLSLGGVVVMTNPLYVAREIEHQWNDAGCTVAITADFLFAQRVAGIRTTDRTRTRHGGFLSSFLNIGRLSSGQRSPRGSAFRESATTVLTGTVGCNAWKDSELRRCGSGEWTGQPRVLLRSECLVLPGQRPPRSKLARIQRQL